MKIKQWVFPSVLMVSLVVGLSSSGESKKEDVYLCKAVKVTSIDCQKLNGECTSSASPADHEILLSNPTALISSIVYAKGEGLFKMKRLSVTKDTKVFYSATTGDLGGMAFYTWLPASKRLFEVKAHNALRDYSTTTLYQCLNK